MKPESKRVTRFYNKAVNKTMKVLMIMKTLLLDYKICKHL